MAKSDQSTVPCDTVFSCEIIHASYKTTMPFVKQIMIMVRPV